MQRQIVETVDGETRHRYVDCGEGRARRRSGSHGGKGSGRLEPMPSGYRMPDSLYLHPAAMVSKLPGDRNSR